MTRTRLSVGLAGLFGILLAAWLIYGSDWSGTRTDSDQPIAEHGHTDSTPQPNQGSSQGDVGTVPGISRATVDLTELFWERFAEYSADLGYRDRLCRPQEEQFRRLLESGSPLPIDQPIGALNKNGVVPPPRREALLELDFASISTAGSLLNRQAQSLQQLGNNDSEAWFEDRLQNLGTSAGFYAPEVIAVMLYSAPASTIAANHALLSELASVREDAAVLYGLAWTELEFYRHCAFQAALDAGIDPLQPADRDQLLAEKHLGVAGALERLEAAHRHYLSGVVHAIEGHLPQLRKE